MEDTKMTESNPLELDEDEQLEKKDWQEQK